MRLYFTYMCAWAIRMSVVCTRISSVYHSYVLACHPYVTRCGFTMNRRDTINEIFHGGNLSIYLVF